MTPCDQSSGLYCDRSADPNNQTGICMGNPTSIPTLLSPSWPDLSSDS